MNAPILKPDYADSAVSEPPRVSWLRWVSPVILIAAGLLMASISWLKWPDLLIDFEDQIYLAWQISEGKVIYKDLVHMHGPFSGYLHGFIFKLFGPGFITLAIFNIFITAALSFLIYTLIKGSSNQLTATVCTLAFITLFAFGQYPGGGNFNFICAYVYELPHGVALSLLALYMFSKYVETHMLTRLGIVYFIVGLVALTKLEVFLAVALALPAGTVLSFHLQSLSMRTWVRNISICISSFLAPFILFYIYLCFHLSFKQALTSILSPWAHALGSSHLSLSFYQWTMGINAIGINLTKLFLYFLTGVAIIILTTVTSRFLIKFKYSSRLVVISMGMLSAGLLYLLLQKFPLLELLRPLPLITALFTVYYFTLLIRKKTSNPAKVLALFSFSLFSFALLLKIILNTHIYHYGFALTLPGTLLVIRWVLYEYPNHKINNIGSADYYLATVLAFGLVIIASHVRFSHQMYQLKGFPVGSGRDVILDYYPELETRGPIVSETLKYVQEHVEPDAGIVPVPYGNMINYMTRHTNPIKFPAFNPLEARMVGEDTYLTAIKTASPQYIIFIDVDSSILGAQYFGVDYAQNIYQWVTQNYSVEKQFGETPFTGAGFGIQILRKNNEIAN